MEIREALEKGKGRARLQHYGIWFAAKDWNKNLRWYAGNYEFDGGLVPWDAVNRTDWLPYPVEEKLCEACRDAKKIVDELSGTAAQKYIDHLRKYHCECGKGE